MLRIIVVFILIFLNVEYLNAQKHKKKLKPLLIEELKFMFKNDQKYRTLISKKNIDEKVICKTEIDSLWRLQTAIDLENTQRLIEIIKHYGYVDSSNSNSKVAIYAILMHTPKKFNNEVSKLIDSEKKAGRIDDASYTFIKWHLDGRTDGNLLQKINYLKENDSINK